MMSSVIDEFHVLLVSNVGSNPRNKPSRFETALSKSLNLFSELDVALIDISHTFNRTNLNKSYPYLILLRKINTNELESNFVHDAKKDLNDLYDVITKVNVRFRMWKVVRGSEIQRGTMIYQKY